MNTQIDRACRTPLVVRVAAAAAACLVTTLVVTSVIAIGAPDQEMLTSLDRQHREAATRVIVAVQMVSNANR